LIFKFEIRRKEIRRIEIIKDPNGKLNKNSGKSGEILKIAENPAGSGDYRNLNTMFPHFS
jgi:hypothetical protein